MTAIADRSIFLQGGGCGVLLIHGLGGTPVELRSVAKGLHAAGYTVLCCQLAGHCGSEADLRASKLDDWRFSVDAGFDRLSATCETVFAGGLSMGGLLALDLARRRPDVLTGLLLYAPTLRHDGWAIPWYAFLLNILIDTPIGRRWTFVESHPYGLKDERKRELIRRSMMAGDSAEAGIAGTPSQSVKQFWRLIADIKRALPGIRVPAFIAHAREDDISSLRRNAFYLQANLGGLVETLVLDDSYHIITLDRQRAILVERSIGFVGWAAERVKQRAAANLLTIDRIAAA